MSYIFFLPHKGKNAPVNNSQMYPDTLHLDTYKITLAFYSIE